MKKIILSVFTLSTFASHTNAQTCCSMAATEQFASLANNKSFMSSHASPLPFHFIADKGKMVQYKTPDGKTSNAFEVKADKPTANYIIMVHEWWGLNDYIKQEAEKLQKELVNVNVIAIDLYDGKVAGSPDSAGKYMKMVEQKRAEAIISGAITYAGPMAKINTIGWCFGGGWALQAALLAGKQASGCVMYYGMPETDLNKLKKLNANVLGLFASKDQWINEKVVNQFQQDMKSAGKKLTVKTFEADHAFANPSNPKYNSTAAAEAHTLAIDFLKKHL